jgi:hypothetical protein
MMLTEPKTKTPVDGWQGRETTGTAAAMPMPELVEYQQQILRALAQDSSWLGGRLPLSFQPSPYRVRVKESAFFASSALACLQLPALLGAAIEVETFCPSNGLAIHLAITDQGVTSHDPAGCVMSFTDVGQASRQSSAQQLIRFFSSAEAAALWLVAYPNVEIVQLGQAWRLAARQHWLDRAAATPTLAKE